MPNISEHGREILRDNGRAHIGDLHEWQRANRLARSRRVVDLYVNSQMSILEVAAAEGLHGGTVRSYLALHGVAIRRPIVTQSQREARARNAALARKAAQEAARKRHGGVATNG